MPVATEPLCVPSTQKLQVGDWAVEPALNQISASGKTIQLEPKAMAALVYLAERPGQVVSREALLSALWSGVLVGDDSLTQVVIKLRKALGDVRQKPAYIQTIFKGGYRLVAPVVCPEEVASAPARPDPESLHGDRARRVPWQAGAGIVALLLAAAGAGWINAQRENGVPAGRVPTAATEAVRTAQPTVTIRAFEALGDDPQAVLLARGITADLVTDLSKVSGLSVIGATAVGG
ncbi:MAG: winged helix-turn-helix domain-containing protein, partial [Ramlibacter sp.]|nr:winged helix-turn-helix domain-containing protein [Ramlibacter sp.]